MLEDKTKKIKLLLIVLSFGFAFANLKAACPPDYEEHWVDATYSYFAGGFTCDVRIYFCCKWDNNLKQVVSQIEWVLPRYNNCLIYLPSWRDFLSWLHQTVAYWANRVCMPEHPPCDDTVNVEFKVVVINSRCMYWENWEKYPGDYVTRLVFCGYDINCNYVYKVCIDYSVNPPVEREIFLYSYADEPLLCPTEEPQLPPPGKSWDEPWMTNCFAKPCE